MGRLYGLDLFSGIGGITLALEPWTIPIAYCEIERYAQSVLLSRMGEGKLPLAPIWDDITSLHGNFLPIQPEIIYGGFPCQDISVAGKQKGLIEGKRSGLFFEILRLVDEINPKFVFLENVPNIRTKGLDRVLQEFTQRGYDCRWTMLSAKEVGACHKRERWFFLAYPNSEKRPLQLSEKWSDNGRVNSSINSNSNMQRCNNNASKTTGKDDSNGWQKHTEDIRNGRNANEEEGLSKNEVFNSDSRNERIQRNRKGQIYRIEEFSWCEDIRRIEDLRNRSDIPEPLICGKNNGVFRRVDRIKCLGNAVVPIQVREAFKKLAGI